MARMVFRADAAQQIILHLAAVPARVSGDAAARFRNAVAEKDQHVAAFHGQDGLLNRLFPYRTLLMRIVQRDAVPQENGRRAVVLENADLPPLGRDKRKGGIGQAVLFRYGKGGVHRPDTVFEREAALRQSGDQRCRKRRCDVCLGAGAEPVREHDLYAVVLPGDEDPVSADRLAVFVLLYDAKLPAELFFKPCFFSHAASSCPGGAFFSAPPAHSAFPPRTHPAVPRFPARSAAASDRLRPPVRLPSYGR